MFSEIAYFSPIPLCTDTDDLRHGKTNTVGSLLLAIAATRLAEVGLDIPKDHLAAEPELTLYAYLQDERDDAYFYYNALLNRLNSFCNALELRHSIQVELNYLSSSNLSRVGSAHSTTPIS